jgi:2-polyprenyl-6-methoxyphenol hydroxylase-like FAD-dependent oxidoreductase
MTMVDCRMVIVDKDHPELGKFIGRGTMFAFSDGRGIIAQRMGDDVIRVYPCLKVPERWWANSGFEWDKPDKIKEKMLAELYHDWDPRLQDIIRHAEPAFTPRPLYRVPLGFHWKTQKGLTLVGDAAHVVSPFAGEGVNLAMLDSLDLFHAIRDHPRDLEAAVAEYEALIPGRTDETNALAQDMMDMAMRDDAPKAYADEMNKAFEGLVPGWTETTA